MGCAPTEYMNQLASACNQGQPAACITLQNQYAQQQQAVALIAGGLMTYGLVSAITAPRTTYNYDYVR
jgi:hypothetical protein